MLIIGAGGLAKQMIEVIEETFPDESLVFFDDTLSGPTTFINRYRVLKNEPEVHEYFRKEGNQFILAVGGPKNRKMLAEKFINLGGEPHRLLSSHSRYGKYECEIGPASVILSGCQLESCTEIGYGCLINLNVVITHDSRIGEFCELGPGVIVCGRCTVGNNCLLGAGCVILPGVHIGDNSTIGAGAVVNKNVGAGEKILGVPGRSV